MRGEGKTRQVLTVAEEIDESNQAAQSELAARDDWYVQHMQLFEDLSDAIQTRHDMIDRAISTAKEIQSKQESFHEQKQAVIEEIKEMSAEEEPRRKATRIREREESLPCLLDESCRNPSPDFPCRDSVHFGTTALEATTAPFPMVHPGCTILPPPIRAPSPISLVRVLSHRSPLVSVDCSIPAHHHVISDGDHGGVIYHHRI